MSIATHTAAAIIGVFLGLIAAAAMSAQLEKTYVKAGYMVVGGVAYQISPVKP